jgi:hypothetical protein
MAQTLDRLFYEEPVTVQDVLAHVKCEFRLVNARIQIVDMDDVTNQVEVRVWDSPETKEWMDLDDAAQFIVDRVTAQEERERQEVGR